MKILIVFYSYSGKTERACATLARLMNESGHTVQLRRVRPREEERSFVRQGRMAMQRQIPALAAIAYDVGDFDRIVFAGPVWAFTFAPALRAYLTACTGLAGKNAAALLTCGTALTSGNALNELRELIGARGGVVRAGVYVRGERVGDGPYLTRRLRVLVEACSS